MANTGLANSQGRALQPPPHTGVELWRQWQEKLYAKGHVRPRIVLHGGYGKGNLGDDAILQILLARVREAFPTARTTVVCHGPQRVRARHQVTAIHFATLNTLAVIASADVYIIGGGGIVNRINTYSGLRSLRILDPKGKFLFIAAAMAKLFGAYVDFHAIGATSFPDPVVQILARLVMNLADAVSVRDKLSKEVLRGAGISRAITVVPDPVVGLTPAPPAVANKLLLKAGVSLDQVKVGINYRYVAEPDVDNSQTVNEVARLVKWLVDEQGAQVIFLPFGRHPKKKVENDLSFAFEVAELIPNCRSFRILEHECLPAEMKAILGQMDLCILERLHSVILAEPTGVPVIAVAYDDKVAAFAENAGVEAIVPLREFSFEAVRDHVVALLES